MPTTAMNAGTTHADGEDFGALNAWWRAANYLSVGQIYLLDNPLLRTTLEPEHVKPRLLGHWGTSPGLNFVYAHLNRVIMDRDVDMMYVIGPGHGMARSSTLFTADTSAAVRSSSSAHSAIPAGLT